MTCAACGGSGKLAMPELRGTSERQAVIVIGSLPVLGLNIARVARREWKRHRQPT